MSKLRSSYRVPASAPGPNTSRIGLAAVAGLLALFFSLQYGNFFTSGNAVAIGENGSSVAIAGMGTMLLLVTGNVDLSIGSMYGFIGMLVALVSSHVGGPLLPIAVGLAAGVTLGCFNGMLVRVLQISPLIVTIGLLAVYAGLGYVINSNFILLSSQSFINIGRGELDGIPYPVVVAAAVLLVVGSVLILTPYGLRLYAIGGDARAAERAGIRVKRMVLSAYALNGLLIGVIAVLTTAQLGSGAPNLGTNFEFDVLTAVILGGVAFAGGAGRPTGVLIGVLTIGILDSGLIFEGLQSWWQQIAKGGILLFALGADQFSTARRARTAAKGEAAKPRDQTDFVTSGPGEDGLDWLANETRPVEGDGPDTPALEVLGVSKRFGAIRALDDVTLSVGSGEVVALLGDNGAGKSTLVKMISGVERPDQGEIRIAGESVGFSAPADARAAGIETVYQDLALCSNLSIAHNLVLGNEPTRRWGPIRVRDDNAAADEARRRLSALGIHITDTTVLVDALSGGQRQAIAVARCLEDHVRVVCLDEPTAALGVTQTAHVLSLIESLRLRGTGVLMITHDVASVVKVSDRVVVLRQGSVAFDGPTSTLSELELLQLMAGLELRAPDGPVATGARS